MRKTHRSVLALGLAGLVAAGGASAQVYGAQTYPYSGNPAPVVDGYANPGYGNGYGASNPGDAYDYARVLRVTPVLSGGYGQPVASPQRCYSRTGSYASDGYGNGSYGYDPYRDDGYAGARTSGTSTGRTIATVIGGVVGAAIGSQVGGGSARYATSALGSMVGGMAGRQVYDNTHRSTGTVRVCDPVPVNGGGYAGNGHGAYGTGNYGTGNYGTGGGVTAYDVTYEYGGRQYTTRMNYNPGSRVRVRVDVQPE